VSDKLKGVTPYIVAIGLGVSGLLALLYWGAPNADYVLSQRQDAKGGAPTARQIVAEQDSQEAVAYAEAVQAGRCNQIIDMTWWMQERLGTIEPGGILKAKEDLCKGILNRANEKNEVTPEGVEDQFIFVPGATIEVVGKDRGRMGLTKPTAKRIWMQVKFPMKSTALRDAAGNRIRALVVGTNVSEDGYILKAEVMGNLEVDFESFSYDWTTKGER